MISNGRTANSVKNVIWNYINLIVGLVLSFLNRAVFLHIFSVELLGISGLFSNVISILSLADLGLSTAMSYSYYKPISENDTEKVAALNNFYRKIYNWVAIIVGIIGVAFLPFLDKIVNLEKPIDNLWLYYLLTLAGTVSTYLVVYKSTLINAYQKNHVVSKYNSLIKILITTAQILFMFLTKNYVIYLVIVVIGNIANNLKISFVADKMFPFIKSKNELDKETKKSIFSNVKSMFIYKLSSVLMNGTDNILISILVGTVWVGYYYNYSMIVTQIVSFITLTFTSLTASVGNLIVSDTAEKKHNTFKMIQMLSFWCSTVLAVSIYVVIDEFIIAWLGTEYVLDELTLFAIMLNLYLTCVLQPIWIYREATGLYAKTKNVMIVTALLNVGLSIVGGIYLGLAGILLASAVSKLLTYVWYEPMLLYKEYFEKSSKDFFLPLVLNFVVVVILVCLMMLTIKWIPLSGWVGFFVKGLVSFGILNLLFIVAFARNSIFKSFLSKIKSVFKK